MKNFGDRVGDGIEHAKTNQSELARALKVRPGTVNAWVKGTALPEGKYLLKLPGLLKVNGHWLLTGDGEMTTPDPDVGEAVLQEMAALIDVWRSTESAEDLDEMEKQRRQKRVTAAAKRQRKGRKKAQGE